MPRGSVPGGGDRPIVIYPPYYPYSPYYYGGYYDPWYGWGGYGGWGFGLSWYYDPFWLGGYGYPGYGGYGYPGYGSGGYAWYGSGDRVYYTGALKLKIKPKTAEVYVDGYYAGVVDDFDGVFQELELTADPDGRVTHRIEIRAAGAQPLTFEVRLQPGQTITYRGELLTASEPKR